MARIFPSALLAVVSLLLPPSGLAGEWNPDKSVKIVVPFNPGGGTDQQARLVEKEFMEEFGQPLSFVYKPGADGAVGATELKDYPADGYNIAVHTFPLIMMNTLTGKGRYSMDDFDYLGISSLDVAVLVTRRESPLDTLEKFVETARSRPDRKLTVGVVEVLGPSHIAALKLQRLGVPMNIIPMAGGAKGIAAVLGGHLDALMSVKGASLNTVSKLNVLAVASSGADPDLSGVPTFTERGFPVEAAAARIWIAPRGLPGDVKARYEEGFRRIYGKDDVKSRLAGAGQPVTFESGQELGRMVEAFEQEAGELVEYYTATKGR